MMVLHRPAPRQPCVVLVAPIPSGAVNGAATSTTILMLVRKPASGTPIAGAHLIELYGLTGAEARVATALLAAAGPREVAARLGIRLSTVRSHLHRLFEKTGTRRQAELVWLLMTLALL
jgi:DNA-binding CsgD family transcriptional regulator